MEFKVKEKTFFLPRSGDIEEVELAKELGFFLEVTMNNNVKLKFTFGGGRLRELPDLKLWQRLIQQIKANKKMQAEVDTKGKASIKRERKRVDKVLRRAAKELELHEPTMMLALEISNNPDAEQVIFGGKEVV
jgi:hypothetical protein